MAQKNKKNIKNKEKPAKTAKYEKSLQPNTEKQHNTTQSRCKF